MITNIIVGSLILVIGVNFGYRYRNKVLDTKIEYLHSLADEIREKNNTMVDNLSKLYQMSGDHDASEFTEMDAMLMEMWID